MKIHTIIALILITFTFSCSISKVSKLPSKKDMSILKENQRKSIIQSEFGQPIESSKNSQGDLVEVYAFEPGHSSGAKLFRGLGYGAAAVYTLGISETLTNPIEGAVSDQNKTIVEVVYDKENRLKDFTILRQG